MVANSVAASFLGYRDSDGKVDHLINQPAKISKTFSIEESSKPFYLDRFLEGLVEQLQQLVGANQIIAAKEEFFVQFGKVFPDDEIFEQRMSLFSEWLVLKKKWPQFDNETFFSTRKFGPCPIDQFFYSLYLILKTTEHSITVYDFFSKRKFVVRVKPSEKFVALAKGSLIQGFIFESSEGIFLGAGIMDHPSAITKVEKKIAEKTITDEVSLDEYLCDLARLNLKHYRHGHVDSRKIYDPKSRA